MKTQESCCSYDLYLPPRPAPKKAKFEYQKQKMEIKICASLAFF